MNIQLQIYVDFPQSIVQDIVYLSMRQVTTLVHFLKHKSDIVD